MKTYNPPRTDRFTSMVAAATDSHSDPITTGLTCAPSGTLDDMISGPAEGNLLAPTTAAGSITPSADPSQIVAVASEEVTTGREEGIEHSSEEKPQRQIYRDMLDFITRAPRSCRHLERCIERSELGKLPHKPKMERRSGVVRAVALTLGRRGNDHREGYEGLWVAYFSHKALAEATYFAEDVCQEALEDLAVTGYLKLVKRENIRTRYILNYSRLRNEAIRGERTAMARKQAVLNATRMQRERLLDWLEEDPQSVPDLGLVNDREQKKSVDAMD